MTYKKIIHNQLGRPSYTIRITRHMFNKVYNGKLGPNYKKAVSGYRHLPDYLF